MKALGDIGESAVCEYLCFEGYAILARNFRIRGGEIDIIAEKDGVIAFVECKARTSDSPCFGAETLTEAQKKRIAKTAAEYCLRTKNKLQPRFDIAEVDLDLNGVPIRINYIENAYDVTDMDIFF
mgnify:CR=1 FL=1